MKAEVVRELRLMFMKLELRARQGFEREELENMFEELINDLFERINMRESVKQAISKIPDSWPQPVVKLFAILVDNIAPEDVNLTVSTSSEGVAIRFNEDQVLRLEKTINNS